MEANREQRSEVVRRIEIAASERQQKTEAQARRVKEFDERVQRLEARKALKAERLRAEMESFRRQQSAMMDAVYKSSVAEAVITEGELERVIAPPKKAKD